MQGMQFQSLVRELKSNVPCGTARILKKKKKNLIKKKVKPSEGNTASLA